LSVNAAAPRKLPSDQMQKIAEKQNQLVANYFETSKNTSGVEVTPFAEYLDAGYLIFSDTFDFDSEKAKLKMAEELPAGMTLVIYTQKKTRAYHQWLLNKFHKVIAPERIKLIYLPDSDKGFWARDGVPVPSIAKDGSFYITDAQYYHEFEPDEQLREYFNAGMMDHNFFFEGGNFMATSLGDCVVINNNLVYNIPDAVFERMYGCNQLLRLPHVKGIGHADESVKFMDDFNVITDEPSYKKPLEDAGFIVHMMPRPDNHYENYVNSLLVNGTIYVPIFGQANDQKAMDIYRSFGYKVHGIITSTLSNKGLGSLHCITMTYPKVPFNELLGILNGSELNTNN
jgi:hypothetical protein